MPDFTYEVRLELKRVKRGTIKVTAFSTPERRNDPQWIQQLPLPANVRFDVHKVITPPQPVSHIDSRISRDDGGRVRSDANGALQSRDDARNELPRLTNTPVLTGKLMPTRPGFLGAVFEPDRLEAGTKYAIHIPSTQSTRAATEVFIERADAMEVMVPLSRAENPVRIKWQWHDNAWYSARPLPAALPFELYHLGRSGERTNTPPVEYGVLKYEARRVGTTQEQMASAVQRLRQLTEKESIQFASAADPTIADRISLSWSVEALSDEKRRHNARVLDEIATHLIEYPDIGMQVHGRTADMPQGSAPKPLAEWFGKRQREDMVELCELLAQQRAEACVTALIQRGISHSRLIATSSARSGVARTDFIPKPLEDIESKRGSAAKQHERRTTSAGRDFSEFLRRNDVAFNQPQEVAAARAPPQQAWNLEHMQSARSRTNGKTLEGIAYMLRFYPDISCNVFATVPSADVADATMAAHFGLNPAEQADVIMGRLARKRAEACVEGLVRRGVDPARLYTSVEVTGRSAKVDFIPQAARRHAAHVTSDVIEVFRKFDRDFSGDVRLERHPIFIVPTLPSCLCALTHNHPIDLRRSMSRNCVQRCRSLVLMRSTRSMLTK